ncbi:hypothetical protein NS365_02905 [Aureimonas ureilytica]|uniref:DUF2059 domain-containing protein n=2 Tax=Aureimonas ureilytica TaxID=401562 RepID=A0A175RY29_9HYPH|nr:hypothetical protein NS365_02905 [Aureimonas ureilytica]
MVGSVAEPCFSSHRGRIKGLGDLARGLRDMAILGMLTCVPVGAASASEADDFAYLRLEQVERIQTAMLDFAAMEPPILEVRDSPERAALLRRGRELAEAIFDPVRTMEEMASALGVVPTDVPERIDAIAERMQALDIRPDAPDESVGASETTRSDKARIDAVSAAMASPELVAETRVTGRRIKWLYESILGGRCDELRALSARDVEAGIASVLADTRAADGVPTIPPLRGDLAREAMRGHLRTILSRLPDGDVAALSDFYTSEAGRQKKAALLQAFRERNDANGRAFLRQLIEDARNSP